MTSELTRRGLEVLGRRGDRWASANEILPGLWLGDWDAANNEEFLKRAGIKTVVNCTELVQRNRLPEITYLDFPLTDFNINMEMRRTAEAAVRAVHNFYMPGANMLVHCAGGVDRSPCIVYKYMKDKGHIDPYHFIRQARPIVNTHIDWWGPVLSLSFNSRESHNVV